MLPIQPILTGLDPSIERLPEPSPTSQIPDFGKMAEAQARERANEINERRGADLGAEQTGFHSRIVEEFIEDHPRRSPIAAAAAKAKREAIHRRLKSPQDPQPSLDYRNPPFDEERLATTEDAIRSHIGKGIVEAVWRDAKNK